ncbi:MAG: TIGR01777 family oxidoreductase [bacterium]
MIVAISGATGFIGQALRRKLREKGWEIRMIDRASLSLPDSEFTATYIEGADVVINLAGAPISKKWTDPYKTLIRESRIDPSRKIAGSILSATRKPDLFISQSAIGIYDSVQTHTETSTCFATGFLATLCKDWEHEALTAQEVTRVVIFRTGLVFGDDGGFLDNLYFPFSIGFGGKIGNGRQAMSFIHLDDLVAAYLFTIDNPSVSGIVNAVTPFPTTNAEFTDKFGKVLKQTAWLTVPSFILRMKLGEGTEMLMEGQKVLPEKLEKAGFRFKYPTVQNALVKIYG